MICENIGNYLESKKCRLIQELQGFDLSYLVKSSEEELCKRILTRYQIIVPSLVPAKATLRGQSRQAAAAVAAATSDSSNRQDETFVYVIPFDGRPDLFFYARENRKPTTPFFDIANSELHIHCKRSEIESGKNIEEHCGGLLQQLIGELETAKAQVEDFNRSIEATIRQQILVRKSSLISSGKRKNNPLKKATHVA